MTRVVLHYGTAPSEWAPGLRWAWVMLAAAAILFPVVATLGVADALAAPLLILLGAQIIGFTAIGVLLLRGDARGPALLLIGFVYLAMMLNALGIAVLVLSAWQVALATLVLIGFSVNGARAVNARISDCDVQKVRACMIDQADKAPVLRTPDAEATAALSKALEGKRSGLVTVLEYAGAFAVVVLGPGLLVPFAVVGDLAATGAAPWIMWLLTVLIFLAARGTVNRQLLILRAIKSAALIMG